MTQTLYELLGGEETIEKLVVAFYQHVLADPMMQPFFEGVPIEKLRCMQKAFFTVALGGPDPEFKISLYEAHQGRGIQREHLTRFTEHLMNTLAEIGIEEDRAQKVYARIAMYSDEVLGESSVDG